MLQRYAFLVVVLLTVSACSRYGRLADDPAIEALWAEQQAVATEVKQWNIYARGALRLEGEAYNIGIRWRRHADGRFMMLLEAPFGQGVLRISATAPGQYLLRLPDGQRPQHNDRTALLGYATPPDESPGPRNSKWVSPRAVVHDREWPAEHAGHLARS